MQFIYHILQFIYCFELYWFHLAICLSLYAVHLFYMRYLCFIIPLQESFVKVNTQRYVKCNLQKCVIFSEWRNSHQSRSVGIILLLPPYLKINVYKDRYYINFYNIYNNGFLVLPSF